MRTPKAGRIADISRTQKGELGYVMKELADLQERRLQVEGERKGDSRQLQTLQRCADYTL